MQSNDNTGKAAQQNFKPQWARSGGGFGAARSPAPAPAKAGSGNGSESQIHETLGQQSQLKAGRSSSGGGLAQSGRRAGGAAKPLVRPNPTTVQGVQSSAPGGASRGAPSGQGNGRFGLSQDLGPGLAAASRRGMQQTREFDQDLGPGLQRKTPSKGPRLVPGLTPQGTPVTRYSIEQLLSLSKENLGPAPVFSPDFAGSFVCAEPLSPVLHTPLQTATIFAEWSEQMAQDREKRNHPRRTSRTNDEEGPQGHAQGGYRRQSSGAAASPGWAGGNGPNEYGERDRFGNMMRSRDGKEPRGGWTPDGRRGNEHSGATPGIRRSSGRGQVERWERANKPSELSPDGPRGSVNLAMPPPMPEGVMSTPPPQASQSRGQQGLGLDAIAAAAQDFEALMKAERQARASGGVVEAPKAREEYIPGQLSGMLAESSGMNNPILEGALEEGTNQPPPENAMGGFTPHDWSTNTLPPANSNALPRSSSTGGAWGTGNPVLAPTMGTPSKDDAWRGVNAPAAGQFNAGVHNQFPRQFINPSDAQYRVQAGMATPHQGVGTVVPPQQPVQPVATEWFYQDPKGNIQGPFQSKDMHEWFKLGFFKGHLPIRRGREGPFVQLANMFSETEIPFVDSPVVPPQQQAGQFEGIQQQRYAPQNPDPRLMTPQAPSQQTAAPAPTTNAWNQGQPQVGQVSATAQEEENLRKQKAEEEARALRAKMEAEAQQKEMERKQAEAAAAAIVAEQEAAAAAKAEEEREAAAKEAAAAAAKAESLEADTTPKKKGAKKKQASAKSAKNSPPKKQEAASPWGQSQAPAKTLSEIQEEEARAQQTAPAQEPKEIQPTPVEEPVLPPRAPQAPAWGGVAKAKVQSSLTLKEIQEQEEAERIRAQKSGSAATPASMSMAARVAAAAGLSRPGAAVPAPAAPAAVPAVPSPAAVPPPPAAEAESGAWSTVGKKSKSITEIQEEESRERQAQAAKTGSLWNPTDSRPAPASGGWASKVGQQPVHQAAPVAKPQPRNVQARRAAPVVGQTPKTAPVAQSGRSSTSSSANAFGRTMSPNFRQWAEEQVQKVGADIALAEFCYTLDSAADIREYIHEYLGSTPQVSAFASEFINRKMASGNGKGANDGGFAEVTRRGKRRS